MDLGSGLLMVGAFSNMGCWLVYGYGYGKGMMISSWTSIVVSWEMKTGGKKERLLDLQFETLVYWRGHEMNKGQRNKTIWIQKQ